MYVTPASELIKLDHLREKYGLGNETPVPENVSEVLDVPGNEAHPDFAAYREYMRTEDAEGRAGPPPVHDVHQHPHAPRLEDAVEAMKHGAADYLAKALDPTHLLRSVGEAIKSGLAADLPATPGLIERSAAMHGFLDQVRRVAPSEFEHLARRRESGRQGSGCPVHSCRRSSSEDGIRRGQLRVAAR